MQYPNIDPAPVMPVNESQQQESKQEQNVIVPNGNSEEIRAAGELVTKYASRIHVTSIALIALGALGVAGSLFHGITARHGAEKWLKINNHSQAKNATALEKGPQYVEMAEFQLVDNLRVIAFLALFASAFIIGLGKLGLRSSWKLKAGFARCALKRSFVRCLLLVFVTLAIRHYVKDSVRIVRKHNGIEEKPHHHKRGNHPHKQHNRKLQAFEDDLVSENLEDWEPVEDIQHSKMRQFIDSMRPKHRFEEMNDEEETEIVENPIKYDLPPWMHKGPFAPTQKFENGVKFEAEDEVDTEPLKETKKEKKIKRDKNHGKKGGRKGDKKQNDKKHRKRHGCCLAPLVTIALIFGHLFQLRNLANALATLENLGGNMKQLKKELKEKKQFGSFVVVDEETTTQEQQIEYTFDEPMVEEQPVCQAPTNYSINETASQMQ